MMLLLTTDINIRNTIDSVNINGYTAQGNSAGLVIPINKIKSIQYAYGTDFIYHYIDKISIGFANTGGNAPVWHQEIPIEIAKIYHSILCAPGLSETTKGAVREDQFIIGHDPHRQAGDFSFQIQTPASIPQNTTTQTINVNQFSFGQKVQSSQTSLGYNTSNEIAMYWNDTSIKEVGFGNISNQDSYSNPNNYQITFSDPKATGNKFDVQIETDTDKTKYISKLNL